MNHSHGYRSLADLRPGDHLCCLYETEAEHRAVLTPFLRLGLEAGQKVVYVVDERTAETVLGYLEEDGLDPAPFLASGQLALLTQEETYLRGGAFDPERMIAYLRVQTEQALSQGYPALRVTGEMTWALRGVVGSERLIEYESLLNDLIPRSPLVAICQYDCRRFAPSVLTDVLHTHPLVVLGTEPVENAFYIPPSDFRGPDRDAKMLRYRIASLRDKARSDAALRRGEERLRHNETRLDALVRLGALRGRTLHEVLDFGLEEALTLTGSTVGYLYFYDEDTRLFTLFSWSKSVRAACTMAEQPTVYELEKTGLWGEAVRQRRPIVTNDYGAPNVLKAGYPEGHVRLTRHVNLPIFQGNRIVAVGGFGNKAAEYDEEDVRQLQLYLDRLWNIVERVRAEDELRLRGEMIANMAEGVGLVRISDGVIVYTNPRFDGMFGYAAGELLGKPVSVANAASGRDPEETAGEILAALRAGGRWEGEIQNVRRDGTPFWCHVTISTFEHPEHGAVGVCIHRDVTGRKRMEEGQKASVEVLRLADSDADAHGLIRAITGYLRDWSECEAVGVRLRDGVDFPYFETRGFPAEFVRAESRLCLRAERGQPARDGAGRPMLECMCGNVLSGRFDPAQPFFTRHGSFWTNSTTELLASTSEADRQAHTRNRCNAEGYESVALIPLRTGGETLGLLQLNDRRRGRFTAEWIGLFEHFAGTMAAALGKRRAEEALQKSDVFLKQTQRLTRVGGWEYDLARRKISWTDEVYRIYEVGPDHDPSDIALALSFYAPHERPHLREAFRRAVKEGEPYDLELEFRGAGGTHKWVRTAARVERVAGKITRVFGHVMDVTERRRAEEALRQAHLEKGRLLDEVNHRVKNNLLSILGLLVAERRLTSAETRPVLEPALERLAGRVRGLLSAHHLLSETQWAPVSVSELATRVLQTAVAGDTGATPCLLVTVEPSRVVVSPRQAAGLALALNELATNTLKHAAGAGGTPAAVRVWGEGDVIAVEYRDDGPGYPDAVLRGAGRGAGLHLIEELVSGTLRGELLLASRGGAVATLRIKREESNRT